MGGHQHQPVPVAPGQKATVTVPRLTDIVILVAGTVDPVNSSRDKRAQSYSNAPPPAPDTSYWEKSREFRVELAKLCTQFRGATLFLVHGWSGDNAIINRRVAGAYIAERLCGGTPSVGVRSKAWYAGYLDQPLSFHLIGHSHGGNVINEFTARTASLPEWPSKWKVKSIVYLSTPFFKRLHPVNTSKFDPAAKILSVFNTYDLTQRVIADFSMLPFPEVLGMILTRADDFAAAVRAAGSFDFTAMKNVFSALRPYADWQQFHLALKIESSEGQALYAQSRRTVLGIRDLLQIGREIVDILGTDLPCYVRPELRGLVPESRKVLSDATAARLRAAIDGIRLEVDRTIASFDARASSNFFPVGEFVNDWHLDTFVRALVDLIRVDPTTLSGPLSDLIADALMDQMDVFDNTSNTVDHQLTGTPFAGAVESLDITSRDRFDFYSAERNRFPGFASRLENIENRFDGAHSRSSLMDLFCTLIAQLSGMHQWLATYEAWHKAAEDALAVLKVVSELNQTSAPVYALLDQARNYVSILTARDAGGMATTEVFEDLLVGDVPYFATVSHRLSHRRPHPRIFEFLRAQMNTGKGAGHP